MTTPTDPRALLRSRSYLQLLILAAVFGVPVSAAAYGFLALVSGHQTGSELKPRPCGRWVKSSC